MEISAQKLESLKKDFLTVTKNRDRAVTARSLGIALGHEALEESLLVSMMEGFLLMPRA